VINVSTTSSRRFRSLWPISDTVDSEDKTKRKVRLHRWTNPGVMLKILPRILTGPSPKQMSESVGYFVTSRTSKHFINFVQAYLDWPPVLPVLEQCATFVVSILVYEVSQTPQEVPCFIFVTFPLAQGEIPWKIRACWKFSPRLEHIDWNTRYLISESLWVRVSDVERFCSSEEGSSSYVIASKNARI
jgi:hypothetical protein